MSWMCPKHKIRQLSGFSNAVLYCADCQKTWKKEVVERFWKAYEEAREKRDKAIDAINRFFEESMNELLEVLTHE